MNINKKKPENTTSTTAAAESVEDNFEICSQRDTQISLSSKAAEVKEKYKVLMADIASIKKDIQQNREKLLKTKKVIDEKIPLMEEQFVLLNQIEESLTDEDITNKMETVQNIAKEVKNNFLVKNYEKNSDHEKINTKTVEELCDQVESLNVTDQTGNSPFNDIRRKNV